MMTEKQAKYSKAVVKGTCWVLKCFIPAGPLQGILRDALDEGVEHVADNINGKISIQELLEDKVLESLEIPKQQYELVRCSILDIFENNIIDENIFEEQEYEPGQIVEYLWNGFCKKEEYGSNEEHYIKKVLYKIILEMLIFLTKNNNFLVTLLPKIQRLSSGIENQKRETSELWKKLDELEKIINGIKEISLPKLIGKETSYKKSWSSTLFLNKEDPKVYLEDVYQVPRYYYKMNKEDAQNDLQRRIDELIKKKNNAEMLLVLGKPGSGKSTLITYIINYYEHVCDKKFLVFPFSTLKNINWNSRNTQISNEILHEIGVTDIKELNEYVLILDGFDEISISDGRENIINQLYDDWVENTIDLDISIIVTCRENYLRQTEIICNFITLCALTEKQIGNFCNSYWNKVKENKRSREYIKRLCSLKEIIGIPLVLYMTIALNVDITETTSVCDIYDKIFCLDNGIYDRCKYNAMGHPLTSPLKEKIHRITKNISIKMWWDHPEEAFISQKQYEDVVTNEDRQNDGLKDIVLIGQYFQYVKYCEGTKTNELRFVHRSIYEYFVALTIYDIICGHLEFPNQEFNMEILKKDLLSLLQRRQLSIDIERYLQRCTKGT